MACTEAALEMGLINEMSSLLISARCAESAIFFEKIASHGPMLPDA
jgi:hypothetical protein